MLRRMLTHGHFFYRVICLAALPVLIVPASGRAQQPSPMAVDSANYSGCDRSRDLPEWKVCLQRRISATMSTGANGPKDAIPIAKEEKNRQPEAFKTKSQAADCWLAYLYAQSEKRCNLDLNDNGLPVENCQELYHDSLKPSLDACRKSNFDGLRDEERDFLNDPRVFPPEKVDPREYTHNVGVGLWIGGTALAVAGSLVTLGLVERRILGGTTQCTDTTLGVLTNNCHYYPRQDYGYVLGAAAITIGVGVALCLPSKHYRYNKFDSSGRSNGRAPFCTPISFRSN